MGRGQRQAQAKHRVRLGDSDTKTRLAPVESAREQLRRRFLAVASRPAVAAAVGWDQINADVEIAVVDQLPLEAASAAIEELEQLGDRQLFPVLYRHWESAQGCMLSLDPVYVSPEGVVIFRVGDVADCKEIWLDLKGPSEVPDPRTFLVYVAREGTLWSAAVVAEPGPAGGTVSESGISQSLGVLAIVGPAPGWDDRDPGWETSNADLPGRLEGREAPLKSWFEDLGDGGCQVAWAALQQFVIRDWRTLLFAYDNFCWWPGRYLDGFDDRFGIAGPVCRVKLELPVSKCVAWAFDEAEVWEIDPAVVAEAFYVLSRLSEAPPPDGDLEEAVAKATAALDEHARSSDETVREAGEHCAARFHARLRQLVQEHAPSDAALTALPVRDEWVETHS
jgi:hypothetical protein